VREVLDELLTVWRDGGTAGLATVVRTIKSAPRPPGATMVVAPDGSVAGSVSGGCVEAAVYELANEVVQSGRPELHRYGISDDDAFAVGLTCGGIIDVFTEPVSRNTFPQLQAIASDIAAHRPDNRHQRAADVRASFVTFLHRHLERIVRDKGVLRGPFQRPISRNQPLQAVSLAQRSGIDAARLTEALAGGWADSVLLQTFVPRMTTLGDAPIGAMRTFQKDVDTIAATAYETGTPMPVAGTVQQVLRLAAAMGLADADFSAFVDVLQPGKRH